MNPILRILAIGGIFCVATVAWTVLGGVTGNRTSSQSGEMQGHVAELWGTPQIQRGPGLSFQWPVERLAERVETVEGKATRIVETVHEMQHRDVAPTATEINAGLHLDQRLKGLMWYSLYDVRFDGNWSYQHREPRRGDLVITFDFPDKTAIYDGFEFVVDGVDLASSLRPVEGRVSHTVKVVAGQQVTLRVRYASRGMNEWTYAPSQGVANLENFHLALTTDFRAIDIPAGAMSPSTRTALGGDGWRLDWTFKQVLTGRSMGMVTPQKIQPGALATSLTFSAPISLLFFFVVLFVLSTLRNIDIHPINYLFLAAAFFAFHLLFGYTVDHLSVTVAFALSSAVSLLLVVSYLRLVVSARFAFVEAAAAQLVYLVGFSLAHFFDGYTGLTVTVLSIATLFLLMEMTGRIRWSKALRGGDGVGERPPEPAVVAAK